MALHYTTDAHGTQKGGEDHFVGHAAFSRARGEMGHPRDLLPSYRPTAFLHEAETAFARRSGGEDAASKQAKHDAWSICNPRTHARPHVLDE